MTFRKRKAQKMAKISVIIPTYNAEETIRDTILSALNQSLEDIEIVIVNDGSTDRTLEIVSNIQASRVKVISIDNSGPSYARNVGIKNTSGKYISFLDSDDIWLRTKLEDQLKILEDSEEIKVVYSWVDHIDEKGKKIASGSRSKLEGNVYKALLLFNFIENGSNVLIERSALEEVGYFNINLRACEDRDMWLRLAQNYSFAVSPKVHVLYRQSKKSLSSDIRNQAQNTRIALELAYRRHPRNHCDLKKKSLFNMNIYISEKSFRMAEDTSIFLEGLLYYLKALYLKPKMIFRRVSLKVFLKSMIVFLIPFRSLRLKVLFRFSKSLNTSTLLGYIDTQIQ
jgi:glycosyltransferase involved in cell wall biosynthesis